MMMLLDGSPEIGSESLRDCGSSTDMRLPARRTLSSDFTSLLHLVELDALRT
jgi:hypothetical protein